MYKTVCRLNHKILRKVSFWVCHLYATLGEISEIISLKDKKNIVQSVGGFSASSVDLRLFGAAMWQHRKTGREIGTHDRSTGGPGKPKQPTSLPGREQRRNKAVAYCPLQE